MPLSSEQRRIMGVYIRSCTAYNWHTTGTHSCTASAFIIDSMERLLDSKNNITCYLFLPNCFIECNNSSFWFKMATALCGEVTDWHELEYGPPINRDDLKQRYVYTCTFKGDVYRFYTKTLNLRELVWYISKSIAYDSADDTDSDDIMPYMYP
jgi:hypothetical protein